MTTIIYTIVFIVIAVLFAAGFYQFALSIARTPSVKTTKTINNMVKRHKATQVKEKNNNSALQLIAKFIRLNPYSRANLEANLKIAGIAKTPEVYYAGAVYKFLQIFILVILALIIFPLLSPVLLILAVLRFIQEKQKVIRRIKQKRKQIEFDLPRFVYSILYELKNNHDVLTIFERHKESLSPEFGGEIAITIADMRTGNYEAALQRLEGRIGSTALSEVVRGLIEMVKGNNTHIYWETLAFRFSEEQKQHLRKEAQKVPPKIKRLSFFLLVCIILIYGVVLGMQILGNIGILF